jgi:hypothetical protein
MQVMYIFPVAEGMLHVTTAGYETTVPAQSPIRHHSSSDIGYQKKHPSCTICTGNKHKKKFEVHVTHGYPQRLAQFPNERAWGGKLDLRPLDY